jgi:hypothetical protein
MTAGKMSEPHWERGYRCHGYWLDGERMGWVGMSPRNRCGSSLYYWPYVGDYTALGSYKTLKAAKRAVERAVSVRSAR